MLLNHLRIVINAFIQAHELIALDTKHAIGDLRDVRMITVKVVLCKSRHSLDPNRQDMPELAQEAADHIGHLCALPDRQIARAVN
jgi:hypothetical protein